MKLPISKAVALGFLAGFLISVVLYLLSFQIRLPSSGFGGVAIDLLWPTRILWGGFSGIGPISTTLLVLAITSLLNGVIYSLSFAVLVFVFGIWRKQKNN